MSKLTPEALKAQAEYQREWRKKNPSKASEYASRYWQKKAEAYALDYGRHYNDIVKLSDVFSYDYHQISTMLNIPESIVKRVLVAHYCSEK